MDALKAWFTPARRKAVYRLGVAVGVFLIGTGIVTAGDVQSVQELLATATGLVLAATNFLAIINVNPEA